VRKEEEEEEKKQRIFNENLLTHISRGMLFKFEMWPPLDGG